MAKVEMSMEEFLQLQSMATSGGGGDCSSCPHLNSSSPVKKKRKSRKKSSSDKKMSEALKEATAMAKKKNGDFKKGWNQSKLMTKAHAIKKKL